jgi:hypothetical protein
MTVCPVAVVEFDGKCGIGRHGLQGAAVALPGRDASSQTELRMMRYERTGLAKLICLLRRAQFLFLRIISLFRFSQIMIVSGFALGRKIA